MVTSLASRNAYFLEGQARLKDPASARRSSQADTGRPAPQTTGSARSVTTPFTAKAADPLKDPDKATLRLQKQSAEALAAREKLIKEQKIARRETIDRAKAEAKVKIEELKKRLELLKKVYANNPKEMAKQMAALAKEFKQAVKDYAAAAKLGGEMFAQEREALGAADMSPEARAKATEELNEEAKMWAVGDLDFAKQVKGFVNKLKYDLETVKIKGTLTVEGKFEQSDEYKDAVKSIKDVDEANEDMVNDIHQSMPPGTLIQMKV